MKERYYSLDRNNKLIWNFRDIGHTMRRISEGKGSQKRVLMILKEEQVITQRDLTEKLGIQPGSASEVIGKLEAAGLLLRVPSQTDRRTADIFLTEAGRKAADAAWDQREERHERMFACLSETEKQTLLELLERVNTYWDQQFCGSESREKDENYRKSHGHHCRG